MTDPIAPGERRELRSVVRQQMKVLRAEVQQRRHELVAEAEGRLVEKYREQDRLSDELGERLARLTADSNRQLKEILGEFEAVLDGRWGRTSGFSVPWISRKNGNRDQLHKAMIAGIDAQVKQATLALDRQEADLLRDLSMEALESSAARSFLNRIPTVGELVPSKRLREIEAQFDAQSADAS